MNRKAKTGKNQAVETRPKRVLVSIYIGVTAARETFSGIVARINGNHPSWVFDYEFDRNKAFEMLKANRDRYDGMIAENPASAAELAALDALNVPIVFTKNVTDTPAERNRIKWEGIPYQRGSVEAVARRGGRVVARHRLETTGKAVALRVEPAVTDWKADGKDVQIVNRDGTIEDMGNSTDANLGAGDCVIFRWK